MQGSMLQQQQQACTQASECEDLNGAVGLAAFAGSRHVMVPQQQGWQERQASAKQQQQQCFAPPPLLPR